MAQPIPIPKLGMTMKEAKIVAWKFEEGQWVEAGKVVLQIETAKVTYDVEAPAAGFLHIAALPGKTLPVGAAAGFLAETQEELATLQAQAPVEAAAAPAAAQRTAAAGAPVSGRAPSAAGPAPAGGRLKISPLARKLAEEHGLDPSTLVGTGPEGRIVKEDVERALAAREAASASAPAAATPAAAAGFEILDGKRIKARLPLQGMRKAIADHMVYSLQVAAQLTTLTELDMTEMVRWRQGLLEREKSIGFRVSYTDLLVYVLARALKAVPVLNASLVDGEVVLWEDINIGVAVALQISSYESGLIVPVVRNADLKSLAEIHSAIASATERARSGKLLPDDVTGSTFTLTNTGVFGKAWAWGTPIINQPESAILQTGPIVERPAVVAGELAVRPMMPVSLTFDHRVLDGAPVAVFLEKFKDLVEHPETLIV
jgi:pyruvate dehydrogenase E2 component (dihydrolipoamide acetyltransferase)